MGIWKTFGAKEGETRSAFSEVVSRVLKDEKDADKSTKPAFRMCTAREVQVVLKALDYPLFPEDNQWVA